MRTKKNVLAFIIIIISSVMFAQKVEVNLEKSSVHWLGKKIGGQHEGSIQLKSSYLEINNNHIVKGKITIDMTSIINTDLKDEGYNKKLVGHLKSDDFFGVEKFPVAEFVFKNSTKFNDGKASITGNITIKGKTESLTFDIFNNGRNYKAKIDIDRSKFDVRYGSNSFFDNLGDKVIDDIFTLNIQLVID